MEETFLKERGLALSLCDGGLKLIFGLMKGGYDLVLGHISPISQPPPPPVNYCTVPYLSTELSQYPPSLLNLPCILYLVAELSRAQSARS